MEFTNNNNNLVSQKKKLPQINNNVSAKSANKKDEKDIPSSAKDQSNH